MNRPRTLFPCRTFECYFDYDRDQGHLFGYVWLDPEKFPIASGVRIPVFSTACANTPDAIQRKAEKSVPELAVALDRVINVHNFSTDKRPVGDKFVGVVRVDLPERTMIGNKPPIELVCKNVYDSEASAKEAAATCRQALLDFWSNAYKVKS